MAEWLRDEVSAARSAWFNVLAKGGVPRERRERRMLFEIRREGEDGGEDGDGKGKVWEGSKFN